MKARLVAAVQAVVVGAVLALTWLPDLIGLAAYALVVSGVWELAGGAWGRIAAGVPIVLVYCWRELRTQPRRP
jgi:hypothetical protein